MLTLLALENLNVVNAAWEKHSAQAQALRSN